MKLGFRLPHPTWAVAGQLLVGVTVFLVAFVAYSVVVAGWVQHRDQRQLQASLSRVLTLARVGGEHESGFFGRGGAGKSPPPPTSPAVALLSIPALHMTQAVLPGVSASHLAEGPALYQGTAQPGAAGNVVIAGHRTLDGAPFYRLDELKPAESIELTTARGRFTYAVVSVDVVGPNEGTVLGNFGDSRLTLVTGDPLFRETHPLVVEAVLTGSTTWPGTTPPLSASPGHDRLVPDVAGSASGWLLAAAGAIVALVAGLVPGRLARSRRTPLDAKAIWVVAGPFVLAGVYLAFHGLSQVLPATL